MERASRYRSLGSLGMRGSVLTIAVAACLLGLTVGRSVVEVGGLAGAVFTFCFVVGLMRIDLSFPLSAGGCDAWGVRHEIRGAERKNCIA